MVDGRADKARKWREQQEMQQKLAPKTPGEVLSPVKEEEMTEKNDKQTESTQISANDGNGLPGRPGNHAGKLWKPGESGNPKGRPPGIDLISIVKKELEREIELTTGEKRTAAQHLVRAIIVDAIKGRYQQQKLIFNYVQGLPKISIDLNHTIRQFEQVAPEKLLEIVRVNMSPVVSGNGRNGKQQPGIHDGTSTS